MQQESKSTADKENLLKRNARDKKKPGSDIIDKRSPAKRRRDAGRNLTKLPEEDSVQVRNSPQATKVEGVNEEVDKSNNLTEHHSTPGKSRTFSDQCTACISNLNPTANYEHIRNFFSDVGGVVAIRILDDKFTGKSRGLAYVDFLDDEHLAAAVAKNEQKLLGKKLSIARFDPKRGRKQSSNQRSLREHTHATDRSGEAGSVSKDSDDTSKGDVKEVKSASREHADDSIQLKGKNTFAAPTNVKPLGWTANNQKSKRVMKSQNPMMNSERCSSIRIRILLGLQISKRSQCVFQVL